MPDKKLDLLRYIRSDSIFGEGIEDDGELESLAKELQGMFSIEQFTGTVEKLNTFPLFQDLVTEEAAAEDLLLWGVVQLLKYTAGDDNALKTLNEVMSKEEHTGVAQQVSEFRSYYEENELTPSDLQKEIEFYELLRTVAPLKALVRVFLILLDVGAEEMCAGVPLTSEEITPGPDFDICQAAQLASESMAIGSMLVAQMFGDLGRAADEDPMFESVREKLSSIRDSLKDAIQKIEIELTPESAGSFSIGGMTSKSCHHAALLFATNLLQVDQGAQTKAGWFINCLSSGKIDWSQSKDAVSPVDRLSLLAKHLDMEQVQEILRGIDLEKTRVLRRRQEIRQRSGQTPNTDDEPYVECMVTLFQAAALVNRSKKTLERRKVKGDMPLPRINSGGGKPDEWAWSEIRPWLEKEFDRPLPKRFPADRFRQQTDGQAEGH